MTLGAHSHVQSSMILQRMKVMELFDIAIAWAIGADSVGMKL